MQEIKDDILERTNQMKSLCLNAETTGIQTIITLADQSEQLENINSHLSLIDTTLDDTKQNISRLKGITRRVIDSFRTKFHQKIISKITSHSTKKSNLLPSSSPRRRPSTPKIIRQNISPSKSFIDGQIDETLYDIENVIHRLKYIAQDMNDQLVGQADTLYHINERMMDSTIHIEQQNTDIKKIL